MTTTVYVKKTGGGVSCILTLTQRPSRANHNASSAPLAATLTVVGVGFIMFEVVDLLLAKLFVYRLQVCWASVHVSCVHGDTTEMCCGAFQELAHETASKMNIFLVLSPEDESHFSNNKKHFRIILLEFCCLVVKQILIFLFILLNNI